MEDQMMLTIPPEANLQLPPPELLDYYKRLDNREIFINDTISDYVEDYALAILNWNREDKDVSVEERIPIKIYINSDGGDLAPIQNLIDMILMSKTPVYTIGMSRCYSSGGLLLMSGHKRFIFPNTSFLVHDGYASQNNSTGKLMDAYRFTTEQERRVKKYILERTEIDEETYDLNYRKDWFMFAEDMIEFGVADEILTSLDALM